MVGLDVFDAKPFRLHSAEVKSIINRNKASANLVFDREMQKLRSNRDKVTGFLREQQKWLADFKSDINNGFNLVPAVRKV